MDILVSSNLERLLFLVFGEDASAVADRMEQLNKDGVYSVPEKIMAKLREHFVAYEADDASAAETLGRIYRETGYLADPHTAVALCAAEQYRAEKKSDAPTVVLATAPLFHFQLFSSLPGVLYKSAMPPQLSTMI